MGQEESAGGAPSAGPLSFQLPARPAVRPSPGSPPAGLAAYDAAMSASESHVPNAVVLLVDGLAPWMLGPYGNTWVETPELNRLAADSLLFEFSTTDTAELATVYRSYWRGLHALCQPEPETVRAATLAGQLAGRNVETLLLTDEPQVAEHPLAADFFRRLRVPSPSVAEAETVDQTQLAAVFAAAVNWLAEADPPFLLWIHVRGMSGPWDAPHTLREQFVEEGDPPPRQGGCAVEELLETDVDPDYLLGIHQAYAAQVVLLDLCLGPLLDLVQQRGDALLAFTSPRGYPLGEHGRVGRCDSAPFGELVQTPLLLRFPDQRGAAYRSRYFAQPADVSATLFDWFALPLPSPFQGVSLCSLGDDPDRVGPPLVFSTADGGTALRSPAWTLVEPRATAAQLFAKPDDRVEANEVSQRCQDVVELLRATGAPRLAALRRGDPPSREELPPRLTHHQV